MTTPQTSTVSWLHWGPTRASRMILLFPIMYIIFNNRHCVHLSAPPANDDNLPDLYRLMASLESPDQQELPERPPSLFTRPDAVQSYKKITELKTEIEDPNIEDYLEKFDEGVRDDILMIGSIELDDVQVGNGCYLCVGVTSVSC